MRTLGGIDALIALQGIEEPANAAAARSSMAGARSMRSTSSSSVFWPGTLDQATLLRLKSASADLKNGSGDERLDGVLSEIDLRVAVELAKAGMN